jgi:XTP/dITP diphosphohydrolase
MNSDLFFVTGNKGKLQEAEAILGMKLQNVSLNIDEIQDFDIENIVRNKAQSAYNLLKKPLIVDDGGVYFDAWNGFPGPMVKFLDKVGGVNLVLKMLKHETNRKIMLRSAIGYHDGKNVYVFVGEIPAKIAHEPRGTNGWSWDTIFVPEPGEITMAEMSDEEKNRISHRRKALEKFKAFLSS